MQQAVLDALPDIVPLFLDQLTAERAQRIQIQIDLPDRMRVTDGDHIAGRRRDRRMREARGRR